MDDFFIPCPVSQWVLKMDNNITLKQALLDIKRILKDVPLDKRDYKWSMTMFWMRQRFRTWVVRWSAGKEVEDTKGHNKIIENLKRDIKNTMEYKKNMAQNRDPLKSFNGTDVISVYAYIFEEEENNNTCEGGVGPPKHFQPQPVIIERYMKLINKRKGGNKVQKLEARLDKLRKNIKSLYDSYKKLKKIHDNKDWKVFYKEFTTKYAWIPNSFDEFKSHCEDFMKILNAYYEKEYEHHDRLIYMGILLSFGETFSMFKKVFQKIENKLLKLKMVILKQKDRREREESNMNQIVKRYKKMQRDDVRREERERQKAEKEKEDALFDNKMKSLARPRADSSRSTPSPPNNNQKHSPPTEHQMKIKEIMDAIKSNNLKFFTDEKIEELNTIIFKKGDTILTLLIRYHNIDILKHVMNSGLIHKNLFTRTNSSKENIIECALKYNKSDEFITFLIEHVMSNDYEEDFKMKRFLPMVKKSIALLKKYRKNYWHVREKINGFITKIKQQNTSTKKCESSGAGPNLKSSSEISVQYDEDDIKHNNETQENTEKLRQKVKYWLNQPEIIDGLKAIANLPKDKYEDYIKNSIKHMEFEEKIEELNKQLTGIMDKSTKEKIEHQMVEEMKKYYNEAYGEECDPFIVACEKGAMEDVERFVFDSPNFDINRIGVPSIESTQGIHMTMTGLMIATYKNQKKIVEFLLSQGASITVIEPTNTSNVMHWAAVANRNTDIIDLIFEYCKKNKLAKEVRWCLQQKDRAGMTPVETCEEFNKFENKNAILRKLDWKRMENIAKKIDEDKYQEIENYTLKCLDWYIKKRWERRKDKSLFFGFDFSLSTEPYWVETREKIIKKIEEAIKKKNITNKDTIEKIRGKTRVSISRYEDYFDEQPYILSLKKEYSNNSEILDKKENQTEKEHNIEIASAFNLSLEDVTDRSYICKLYDIRVDVIFREIHHGIIHWIFTRVHENTQKRFMEFVKVKDSWGFYIRDYFFMTPLDTSVTKGAILSDKLKSYETKELLIDNDFPARTRNIIFEFIKSSLIRGAFYCQPNVVAYCLKHGVKIDTYDKPAIFPKRVEHTIIPDTEINFIQALLLIDPNNDIYFNSQKIVALSLNDENLKNRIKIFIMATIHWEDGKILYFMNYKDKEEDRFSPIEFVHTFLSTNVINSIKLDINRRNPDQVNHSGTLNEKSLNNMIKFYTKLMQLYEKMLERIAEKQKTNNNEYTNNLKLRF